MEQEGRQKTLKIVFALISLAMLGGAFFLGALFGYNDRPTIEKIMNVEGRQPLSPNLSTVDFNQFWDVWLRVEDKFVDKAKIDRKNLVNGAISGMVHALGDPYTEYMPPAESKQFNEDIKGAFEGIGAEIGIRKDMLTIIAPLKDSPAEQAGLKPDDKILKIDEKVTVDMTLNEAVRHIRGPKGSKVTLTIMRTSFKSTKEFSIVRDTIKVQVLKTEKRPDGIFVIRLYHFTENAGDEFRKAVLEFQQSGSRKLVFDLRNNPGGFLTVAVDIASWFEPAGETVARERYGDGTEDTYRSTGYRVLENVPTVVLINQGSASASEIVAGALRDVKGIKLIGQKSFGKGSVQEVEPLPEGASLKITIAKWLTPKGTEINGKGLEPDVKVDVPEPKEDEEEKDVIMEKAVEVLKGM